MMIGLDQMLNIYSVFCDNVGGSQHEPTLQGKTQMYNCRLTVNYKSEVVIKCEP